MRNTEVNSLMNFMNRPGKGTPIDHTPYRVGDPIGDRWMLLGYIGRGAQGVVYLVSERETGDLLALKTIRDEVHADIESRKRFYDEALMWSKIDPHPHILYAKDVLYLWIPMIVSSLLNAMFAYVAAPAAEKIKHER